MKNQPLHLLVSLYNYHSSFQKCPSLLHSPAGQLSAKSPGRFLSIHLFQIYTKYSGLPWSSVGPENTLEILNLPVAANPSSIAVMDMTWLLSSIWCLGSWDQQCSQRPWPSTASSKPAEPGPWALRVLPPPLSLIHSSFSLLLIHSYSAGPQLAGGPQEAVRYINIRPELRSEGCCLFQACLSGSLEKKRLHI